MATNQVEYIIRLRDLFSDKLNNINNSLKKTERTAMNLQSSLLGLTAGFLSVAAASDIIKTAAKFDAMRKSVDFATGSAVIGGQAFEYLRIMSNQMGLDLQSNIEGFKMFGGAMMNQGKTTSQQLGMYKKLSYAFTVLGMSAEEAKGSIYAFGQIISKGKLMAEELTRQLGNRIPGAQRLMAEALGMSTQKMMAEMKKGTITGIRAVEAFANYSEKVFASGVEKASKSLMGNLNRFNNVLLELKLSLAESLIPYFEKLGRVILVVSNYIKTHKSEIDSLLSVIKNLVIWFTATKISMLALSIGTGIFNAMRISLTLLNVVTRGLSTSTRLLKIELASLQSVITFGVSLIVFFALEKILGKITEKVDDATDSYQSLNEKMEEQQRLIAETSYNDVLKQLNLIEQVTEKVKTLVETGETETKLKWGKFLPIGIETSMKNVWGYVSKTVDKVKSINELDLTKTMEDTKLGDLIKQYTAIKEQYGMLLNEQTATGGNKALEEKISYSEKLLAIYDKFDKSHGGILTKLSGGGVLNKDETKITSTSPKVININIGNLINDFKVMANNITESGDKIKDIVLESLLKAINETSVTVGY